MEKVHSKEQKGLILGIDEAGRGPVLGPMVMAGVMMEQAELYRLENLKVRDSKLLTPLQREHLFEKIRDISQWKIIVILPQEIDDALDSTSSNLNWLEAQKSAEIINALNPGTAIIDSPSNNIKKYAAYLRERVSNKKIRYLVEHKADFNHRIVGAASILAKVTRDREIQKLQEVIPYPIGSGYASDPVTIEFVKKHHEQYSHILRKTWAPYKAAIDKKKQRNLEEF